jgi:hypothetical protein
VHINPIILVNIALPNAATATTTIAEVALKYQRKLSTLKNSCKFKLCRYSDLICLARKALDGALLTSSLRYWITVGD